MRTRVSDKYLMSRSGKKECLITSIRQNLFECLFENYDLWL